MKTRTLQALVMFPLFAALAMLGAGCGSQLGPPKGTSKGTGGPGVASSDDDSGWWCVEHGVPEEECSMCSTKMAAEFKKKGDWCKEHDRAESQCFICNPDRSEKFASRYEAKFGKKPPVPDENVRK
jgi:hypothetical protein